MAPRTMTMITTTTTCFFNRAWLFLTTQLHKQQRAVAAPRGRPRPGGGGARAHDVLFFGAE
eukprot:1706810-Lingulodinium_polyedra.AAC.1